MLEVFKDGFLLEDLTFQPSENEIRIDFNVLAKYFDNISKVQLNKLLPYYIPIICICLPGLIVMSQPDLGTGLTIILIRNSYFILCWNLFKNSFFLLY